MSLFFFNPKFSFDSSQPRFQYHQKLDFLIIFSKSLNDFLLYPTYGHIFHVLAFHPHATFAAYSGWIHSLNPIRDLWWRFFAETVNVFRPLAVVAEKLRRWCLAKLLLPPNSPDSYQKQIQEDVNLDWTHVLISLKENRLLGRQG